MSLRKPSPGARSEAEPGLRPQPGILEIAPYVGGESELPGIAKPIKLASNESALGPSPKAVAAFKDCAATLHRYPDGSHAKLRAALARRYGIDAAGIVCGNGSDELLAMLAKAYSGPGDEVLYTEHGFLLYPIVALAAGATPVSVPEKNLRTDVDAIVKRAGAKTRIVFVANPNNPTGSYIPASEMRRLREKLPSHVLLVIDAAYAEFVTAADYSAGAELVQEYENVVMTRTFSKIYALSALRLGWALCPPAVTDVLNRLRGPFNINSPALAAGVTALEDVAAEEAAREHNTRWRERLTQELSRLGLHVYPSVTNFLLVKFGTDAKTGAAAADKFLRTQGLIVRRVDNYGFPDCLRVSIGREDELKSLISALEKFLGHS
jgi:histidinol-phosphate aminotransferase